MGDVDAYGAGLGGEGCCGVLRVERVRLGWAGGLEGMENVTFMRWVGRWHGKVVV